MINLKISPSIMLCGAIIVAYSTNSFAASSAGQLQQDLGKLKKQIQTLSEKLKKVDKKIKKRHQIKTTGGNLYVKDLKRKRTFRIGGLFQSDLDAFDGAYNANLGGEQASDVFARRIRASIGGKYNVWDYKLLLDFAKDEDFNSSLILARLRYSGFKKGPKIKYGLMKEDISLEALSSSNHTTSISRSMLANTMTPNYRWGVSAYQNFEPSGVRYALGVYKGDGFGSSGHDENESLTQSYAGRVTWSPLRKKDKILHLGIWKSRHQFGDNEELSMQARGEVKATNVQLLDYAAGGSKYIVESINQYGLEAATVWGPWSFQAEQAIRYIDAKDSANNNRYNGYYAQLSYFLTGEYRKYSRSAILGAPKFSGKPAWEIFLKKSNFDAVSDDRTQGTEVDVNTIGVNYYQSSKIKFMLNLISSKVSGPGTVALVGDDDKGSALAFRVQFAF